MGIKQNFSDTASLFKQTFTIIQKNREILKPTIRQLAIALVVYLLIVISGVLLFTGGISVIVLVLSVSFLLLIFPFMVTYYKAVQSWLVYQTFTGKITTYKDGSKRASINKGDICILTIADMILTAFSKKLQSKKNKSVLIGILTMILGKILEESWDILNHFLLPASIIQEKHVGQAIAEIPSIKKNVSGALAGVLGIDFAGDLVTNFLGGLSMLAVFVGFILLVFTGSFIPLVIIVMLMIALFVTVNILVQMVKTIYFTLFYVSVMKPSDIASEYKKEVEEYLVRKEPAK